MPVIENSSIRNWNKSRSNSEHKMHSTFQKHSIFVLRRIESIDLIVPEQWFYTDDEYRRRQECRSGRLEPDTEATSYKITKSRSSIQYWSVLKTRSIFLASDFVHHLNHKIAHHQDHYRPFLQMWWWRRRLEEASFLTSRFTHKTCLRDLITLDRSGFSDYRKLWYASSPERPSPPWTTREIDEHEQRGRCKR